MYVFIYFFGMYRLYKKFLLKIGSDN